MRPARSLPATLLGGTALLGLLLGVSGCGDDNADAVAAVRGAGPKSTDAGSSRLSLASTTRLGTQNVTFQGEGRFDYAADEGLLDLTLGSPGGQGGGTIKERIVDGSLYVALPGRDDAFYKLELAKVAGTSLGSSTDPAAAVAALQGVSGEVEVVGKEQVRGDETTHYRGQLDVKKAIDAAPAPVKTQLNATLGRSGATTVPFDAYVDDEGRLRRYVQELQGQAGPQAGGQKVQTTTTLEFFDFGVPVDVQPPPAAQVKDGKPLLDALNRGGR